MIAPSDCGIAQHVVHIVVHLHMYAQVIAPVVVRLLVHLHHTAPVIAPWVVQWSVQLHHDNLRAAAVLFPALGVVPSYSSLKRYFRNQGLVKRRKPKSDTPGARRAVERMEANEIRSYETEHVGALYHLDFHHCSRRVLEPDGRWIKPLLLGVIDDHSRLGCHFQWY